MFANWFKTKYTLFLLDTATRRPILVCWEKVSEEKAIETISKKQYEFLWSGMFLDMIPRWSEMEKNYKEFLENN